MRQRHDFSVTAYVVMPEHIHHLVSEPRARLLARRFRRLSLNQSSTYAYDGFNRLTGTSTGGSPAYSFVYDRWGNRLQQNALQGGTTSVLNVNTSTNQVTGTAIAPGSFTYDAAGNLTYDGAYTYTYDPDGNVLTVGTSSGTVTTTYTYDALNRRVRIQAARGTFEFAFDANGRRVSTWNAPGGSLSEALAYWGAQPVAFHTPGNGGYTHFQYQDWLGTERLRTSGATAAVEGTYKSLPYGDGYTSSGNDYDWYHFAGQDFDPESNTQHAQFRQYASVQGRWMSPDPYDGSYDAGNPQSLNRYSYVLNNPMGMTDPSGLDPCGDDPNCVTAYASDDPFFCWECMEYGYTPYIPYNPPPTPPPTNPPPTTPPTAPSKPHTQCPRGTYADTSGTPDYQGGATEYGVNADGTPTRFAGRRTAGGSIFDPWGYTAATIQGPKGARWTIPRNTFLNVVSATNPSANVVVQITDTGLLGPGDVIDLSAGAMKTLTGKPFNSVPVRIYTCRAR